MTAPTPENSRPQSYPPSRNSSFPNIGYFSNPFERWKDEQMDWASAFTLLDTFETFWDARVDLWERRLRKHGKKVLQSTQTALKKRGIEGDAFAKDLDKELSRYKAQMAVRMQAVNTAWHSTKVVRTREKLSFFFGVHAVLGSALLACLYPEWLHVVYTLVSAYMLPARLISYRRRLWHYFLFDFCYYVNILNFIFLWIAPGSPALFVACYCLSHGSLAMAVPLWRNSLVFHDADKVTSLWIHIYPPLVFTTIRHFYPGAETRFPALNQLNQMQPLRALAFSCALYLLWQALYWKFVYVDRREKVESGKRTISLTWLLADQRGGIGKALASVAPERRVACFMLIQFLFTIVTEIPPVYFLYDSPKLSVAFLFFIFAVSVWNGGRFYVEVFGRKFEKELEALRKELAEMTASQAATPTGEHKSTPLDGSASSSEDDSEVMTMPSHNGTAATSRAYKKDE